METFEVNEIIEIEAIDRRKVRYVYDISVEETERFFSRDPKSNGYILVHNTSMYPSLDIQYNISYETFQARIYESFMYKFMNHFKSVLDNRDKKLLSKIKQTLYKYLQDYIKNILKPSNMSETIKYNKLFIDKMINTIYESGIMFDDLINVKNYYLTKTKFIPLLEIISLIHPEAHEYCDITYDWIFMDESDFDKKYKNIDIWVNDKPTDSEFKIKKYSVDELKETLIKNYIITPSGCLFKRHDEQLGILNDIVINFIKLRKKMKKIRDSHTPDSFEYKKYDNIQNSTKILLNSISYGVIALTSYRYNEVNVGRTITIGGRVLIKTSQYIANEIIKQMNKK